ncbi:outer membrane protein [Bradyrhizobium neotropicale]|uniref:Outer membrane protein beta-barrel domain-containing protein n=1 Tax=Bradyrhizobium neotropicale TaxID=1497615 RepID=A0A176ZBH3_9BRAD|nr:outer membrane beta-barrel protein [Bradyrhizobium neotropicale]OAF17919.1 hypothetical protein AXW67_06745 [Bradyrhizobium neotropicale]
MRTPLVALAVLLASSVAGSAADLAPVYTKAPAAVYNWTGFYIGGNLGGGMASSHFDDPCFYCSNATPTAGFFTGGAQVGYNYQIGSGLVGIEADVNGNSNFKSSILGGDNATSMTITTKADVSGTIRARAGVVVNNALIYATGGAAWADVKQTGIDLDNRIGPTLGSPTGYTANRGGVLWGGVIGAGVEFALGNNWILGGEFLHTMYKDRAANILSPAGGNGCVAAFFLNNVPQSTCVIRDQLTTDVARIRLSYKFGDPVPSSAGAALAYANSGGVAPLYAKAPAVASIYSWTGFYIGGNAGGGMASSHFDDPCVYCSSATPTSGFFTGGGQIGYNYQFGSGLVGIEADVNGNSSFKDSVLGGDFRSALAVATKADVSGTIRGRAGLVVNNALVYVTGGAAWADVKQTGVEFNNLASSPTFGAPTGFTANRSGVLWGGVVGAGVEFALASNWIVGGEFLHTMYEDRSANIVGVSGLSACANPANCVIRNQLTTDVARLRLNYKFGGAPSDALAYAAPAYTKAAPLAVAYNWSGFYVGGNAGGGLASSHFDDPCLYCSSTTPTGGFFTGGGQIGYNYQFGRGLVGIEADVNGNSKFKDSVLGGTFNQAMTVSAKDGVIGRPSLWIAEYLRCCASG